MKLVSFFTTITTAFLLAAAPAQAVPTAEVDVAKEPPSPIPNELVSDAELLAEINSKAIAIDIPWDKVIRQFTSMVACQALIPVYEIRNFPSAILCLPRGDGGAVMIIVKISIWD